MKKAFTIALVGQPNSGKSTLFNVLSDRKVMASNFSGTSVEISRSDMVARGRVFHVVDLPGIYSLNPGDEAENVTLRFLMEQEVDLIVNVVDASLLSRSLELTVELAELGIPMVIALNMWDEAGRKGLQIYPEKLEERLGIKVRPTSALYGKGVVRLVETSYRCLVGECDPPRRLLYTSHIEELVRDLEARIRPRIRPPLRGSARFYAIKLLENTDFLPDTVMRGLNRYAKQLHRIIRDSHHIEPYEAVSYERHHLAMKLTEEISHFVDRRSRSLRERLDRFLLHPVAGQFFMLLYLVLFFVVIFQVGNLLSGLMEPLLERIPPLYAGLRNAAPFWWHTVNGAYQGFAGALGIVLPYFLPLSFLTALFMDTGYLARMAFLLDGVMHRIGLHGKSVAPFIMGMGCSVPAVYATRIIENRRDRTLTAILIPFIPCSARTAVIFALTAAFAGPLGAVFAYLLVAVVIGASGKLMTLFLGKPTGLILEIPDLRVPSAVVSLRKTWTMIREFLFVAVPFLVAGSIGMSWLELAKIDRAVNAFLAPFLQSVLGLPAALGAVLVFAFFRKELVLIMATVALGAATLSTLPLTPEQVMVFVVFVTFYFPCFSTFVVMWKEFGARIAWGSAALSLVVATLAAQLVRVLW
ncbi:MAG TPA: ferrous iron transport protein B [Candidatus Aminicenantes bacterium]|nr:ferrous iron transport protein B [Candidatus Aminicenantes bacterium]